MLNTSCYNCVLIVVGGMAMAHFSAVCPEVRALQADLLALLPVTPAEEEHMKSIVKDGNQMKFWAPFHGLIDHASLLWQIRTCNARIDAASYLNIGTKKKRARKALMRDWYIAGMMAMIQNPDMANPTAGS